jgi:hypothetical protein
MNDLKNVTLLRQNYDKSIDEVWSKGVRLNSIQPFGFVQCITINAPIGYIPKNHIATVSKYQTITFIMLILIIFQLFMYIKQFGTPFMLVEKHEVGQTRHNYMLDFNNDIEVIVNQPGNIITKNLKPRVYEKVKTKGHKCIEDNSQRFTQCMNSFIMTRLSCTLPWLELGGSRAAKGYFLIYLKT